jgi:hypothetical protein
LKKRIRDQFNGRAAVFQASAWRNGIELPHCLRSHRVFTDASEGGRLDLFRSGRGSDRESRKAAVSLQYHPRNH